MIGGMMVLRVSPKKNRFYSFPLYIIKNLTDVNIEFKTKVLLSFQLKKCEFLKFLFLLKQNGEFFNLF